MSGPCLVNTFEQEVMSEAELVPALSDRWLTNRGLSIFPAHISSSVTYKLSPLLKPSVKKLPSLLVLHGCCSIMECFT